MNRFVCFDRARHLTAGQVDAASQVATLSRARLHSARDVYYWLVLNWRRLSNPLAAVLRPSAFRYFHIVRDTHIVGTLLVFVPARYRNGFRREHVEISFRVNPEARGAGVGLAAVTLAIDHANRTHRGDVYALVRVTNDASIATCQHLFDRRAAFTRRGTGPFASFSQTERADAPEPYLGEKPA